MEFGRHDAFGHLDQPVCTDLSAVAQSGSCLWLASDETASIERLTALGDETYGAHRSYPLTDFFDLPGPAGQEADIEGLAVDGGYLWMAGSHSLKRKKPKAGRPATDALDRLTRVEREANRALIGRIPLVPTDAPGVLEPVARVRSGDDRGRSCARFAMRGGRNGLMRALAKDTHLGRFLNIPAKENGFDIEGLAAIGDRLFIGLRGPVLRGWAVILDIEVEERRPGRLDLRAVGPNGALYRKHFLDLDGLGIRELVLQGDDLLILAGPTMDLDGPVALYRWRDAASSTDQAVIGRDRLARILDLPHGQGTDHAEGIAVLRHPTGADRLILVYDSPAPSRLHAEGTAIDADLFVLP